MMGGGMMGRGPGGMSGEGWEIRRYLASLKAGLGVTAQQEPAWNDYADAVMGAGEPVRGLHRTMFEAMDTASWQERREMMNRMFQARMQAYDTVHAAAEKLLPRLDPPQRAKAAEVLPGLARQRGMMGR
jgi:hypothetical protein